MNNTQNCITINEDKKKNIIIPSELKDLVKNDDEAVRKKILNHRLEVEDNIYKNTWKSCCIVMDRRAVQYFTQIIIIGSCMAFSIIQLIKNESCEAQQAYMGLLTLLIGLILPNPKFKEM